MWTIFDRVLMLRYAHRYHSPLMTTAMRTTLPIFRPPRSTMCLHVEGNICGFTLISNMSQFHLFWRRLNAVHRIIWRYHFTLDFYVGLQFACMQAYYFEFTRITHPSHIPHSQEDLKRSQRIILIGLSVVNKNFVAWWPLSDIHSFPVRRWSARLLICERSRVRNPASLILVFRRVTAQDDPPPSTWGWLKGWIWDWSSTYQRGNYNVPSTFLMHTIGMFGLVSSR
jgi:hypothetical protein